jgi:hypothetical protein
MPVGQTFWRPTGYTACPGAGRSSLSTNRRRSVSREMSGSVSLTISSRLCRFPKSATGTLREARAAFAKRAGADPCRNHS